MKWSWKARLIAWLMLFMACNCAPVVYAPAADLICAGRFTSSTQISGSSGTINLLKNYPPACGNLLNPTGMLAMADAQFYYMVNNSANYQLQSTVFSATQLTSNLVFSATPSGTLPSFTFGALSYVAASSVMSMLQVGSKLFPIQGSTTVSNTYSAYTLTYSTKLIKNGDLLLGFTPYYVLSGIEVLKIQAYNSGAATTPGFKTSFAVGSVSPSLSTYVLNAIVNAKGGTRVTISQRLLMIAIAGYQDLRLVMSSSLSAAVAASPISVATTNVKSTLRNLQAVAPTFLDGCFAIFLNNLQLSGPDASSVQVSMVVNYNSVSFAGSAFSVPFTVANGAASVTSVAVSMFYIAQVTCSGGTVVSLDRTQCIATCPGQAVSNLANMCGCSQDYSQFDCTTICSYTCAACYAFIAGTHACFLCSPKNKRVWNANSCICYQGYYDDGVSSDCVACYQTCVTCNGPASNNCLTCNSPSMAIQTGQCVCNTGYSQGSQCLSCEATCLTCSGPDSTNCLTCSAGRTINLQSKSCDCNTGKYSVPGQTVCVNCFYSCTTCLDGFSCTSCSVASKRVLTDSQKCVCIIGFFDDTVSLVCVACSQTPFFCLTCSLAVCSSCDATSYRFLSSGFCKCVSGFFSNGNVCTKCTFPCITCSNALPNSCLTCALDSYLDSTGVCNCALGLINILSKCQKCDRSCVTCSNVDPASCLSCDITQHRVQVNTQCSCDIGFFQAQLSYCAACDSLCMLCIGTSSNCVGCRNNLLLSDNTCICGVGFYLISLGGICLSCNSTCYSCINSYTCASCEPDTRSFTSGGQCVCKLGYFDGGASACVRCDTSCATCLNSQSNSCLSCSDPTRSLRFRQCSCILGYFQVKLPACITCPIWQCITCISATQCGLCSQSTILVSGLCTCPIGQYVYNSVCQNCAPVCKTCTSNANVCNSCQVSAQRLLPPNCLCIDGYYDSGGTYCQRCSSLCQTCTSSVLCTSCPFKDLSVPNCLCTSVYYQDSYFGCLPCDYSCLTCQTRFACLSCPPSRILQNFQCNCSKGFVDTGTLVCSVTNCPNNCYECSDIICLYCASNRALIANQCLCVDGFIEIGGTCSACSPVCLACSGSTNNCVSCVIQLQTLDANGNCLCISGTYSLGSQCVYCPISCLTCSSSYCSQCFAGFLNANGLCVKTCSMGQFYHPLKGFCLPSCQRGSFFNYDTSTCQGSTDINLQNSTSYYFFLQPVSSKTGGYQSSIRNQLFLNFSQPTVLKESFQNLFSFYADGLQLSFSIINATSDSYVLKLETTTSSAYPHVIALLSNRQMVSSARNSSIFIQNNQANVQMLELLDPSSVPDYLYPRLIGVLSFVVVAISLPGSHYLSEMYAVCVLLIRLQSNLPFTLSTWYFIRFDPWYPSAYSYLQKLLVQLFFCILAQLLVSIIAIQIMPSSLLTKRVSFYVPSILFYTAFAYTAQLLYFAILSALPAENGLPSLGYWWLVAITVVGSVALGCYATNRNKQLFGIYYDRSIDNFYAILRLARLILLPFATLIGNQQTRLTICLVVNGIVFLFGFYRKTAVSLLILQAVSNLFVIVLNLLVILLLPSNASRFINKVFVLGSSANNVTMGCMLLQLSACVFSSLRQFWEVHKHYQLTSQALKRQYQKELENCQHLTQDESSQRLHQTD